VQLHKGNDKGCPSYNGSRSIPPTGFKLQDNQTPCNSTHYFAFTRMPLSLDHLLTTDLSLSLMMIQASIRPSFHILFHHISNDSHAARTAAYLCLAPIIISRFHPIPQPRAKGSVSALRVHNLHCNQFPHPPESPLSI